MKLMNKFTAALLAGVALLAVPPDAAHADGYYDPFGFNPPTPWWSPPPSFFPLPELFLPDLIITNVIVSNDGQRAFVKVSNIGQAIANPSSVRASNGLGNGLGNVGEILPGRSRYCLVVMEQGASLKNCASVTNFDADCFRVVAELNESNNSKMIFCN